MTKLKLYKKTQALLKKKGITVDCWPSLHEDGYRMRAYCTLVAEKGCIKTPTAKEIHEHVMYLLEKIKD